MRPAVFKVANRWDHRAPERQQQAKEAENEPLVVPIIGRDGELIAALGIAYPSKPRPAQECEYHAVILLKSGAHTLAEGLHGTAQAS